MTERRIAQTIIVFVMTLFYSISPVAQNEIVHANSNLEKTETMAVTNGENYTPKFDIENRYYYNQLKDDEKEIYDQLLYATDYFLAGKEITLKLLRYDEEHKKNLAEYYYFVKRVIKAYTYDNPEAVIWFENYNRTYYITEEKDYVYMTLSKKSEEEATSSLKSDNLKKELMLLHEKAMDFIATLKGSDFEKITQIHNWIIEHVEYDKTISVKDRDNPYGPIMKGEAICSGYSYAFKYMADLAGLKTVYVVGKAYDSKTQEFKPHAWNLVFIDKEWYLVDVTFDETVGERYLISEMTDNVHYPDMGFGFVYPN